MLPRVMYFSLVSTKNVTIQVFALSLIIELPLLVSMASSDR